MKTATCAFAVLAACAAAFAEPSVLELGFELGIKPSEKPAAQEPEVATNSVVEAEAKSEVAPAVVTNVVAEVEAEAVAPATNALAEAVAVSAEEPAEKTAEEEAADVKPKAKKLEGRPARITSDSTIYNRKEGIACFEGHVHVDDEQYQMHADRVFLFLEKEDPDKKAEKDKVAEKHGKPDGTNDVKRASSGAGEVRRIVAIGNIAMTNEARRAYGAKATYSRKNGLVVLYSGDGITAEVRDESKAQPQVVRGKRIRFWLGSEQVEVDEADLTGAGPAGGASSLKKVLGK